MGGVARKTKGMNRKEKVTVAAVLIIMLAVMAHRVFHVSAPRHGPRPHATSSWR